MNESLRYTKGLGNAAIYARIPNAGQFWDFVNLAWAGAETANCRIFLTEFGDTSTTESWYYGTVTPPSGGPWSIELIQLSTGAAVGNDFAVSTPYSGAGTIKCSTLLSGASRQLTDAANITWPTAVLMSYLNMVCKEIVNLKPEANAVTGLVPLVAGTRQALPKGTMLLIKVDRNMGEDGQTPGQGIRQLVRRALETLVPDWPTLPASETVQFVVTDDRDPYNFDVVPPQPVGTQQKIQAIMATLPARATDPVNDNFPLPDEYEVPVVIGMVAWALSESNSIPNALNKANSYFQRFYQSLGVKNQADKKVYSEGQ